MADIDVVQKPAGNLTWLWALVAVLAVGGLMAWLAVQSDRTTTAAVVQEQPAEVVDPVDAVQLGALAGDPAAHEGREIRVEAPVAAQLGPRAFWGDVPGANPFLVVLTADTPAPALEPGRTVTVEGWVLPVTDQLVDEWIAAGALTEGARAEATFATHALVADRVVR
jgi:hypothetical protein